MKPIVTPIPEVADRYTIALLKIQRLDASEIDVDEMQRQIDYYKEGLELDNPELADLVWRLRPLVEQGVLSEVARAMEIAANKHLGDRLSYVLEALYEQQNRAPTHEAAEQNR